MKHAGIIVCAAFVWCAAPQLARAQGVHVALLPASQTVAPGDTFNLEIDVTQAGSSFNAFDIYIGYDPTALTLLPRSPLSQQEGSYFASACPNRLHRFRAGTDRDTISDVLLCSGVSVPGPGQIYRLHFQASSTIQVTWIRFLPGLQFYNDGLYVNPDSSMDAVVGIGVPLAVPTLAGPSSPLRLSASPNPALHSVAFQIHTDRPEEQRLLVTDVQGRVLKTFPSDRLDPGIRTVSWDLRTDAGTIVRPGTFFAILRAGSQTARACFTILDR